MQIRNLLNDDDAVSPVIGVILMVAITVILAAVIATFVLGLGEQVSQTSPNASFTFDYDEGADQTGSGDTDSWGLNPADDSEVSQSDTDGLLTVTHAGGATIDAARLAVVGASPADYAGLDEDVGSGSAKFGSSSKISAGSSFDIWISNDDTIRITWTSQEGQDSATLTEFDGPEA